MRAQWSRAGGGLQGMANGNGKGRVVMCVHVVTGCGGDAG